MASLGTSTREDNGWRRHQDTGLQSGRLAQNVQDIMLATLIRMKQMMISSNNNQLQLSWLEQ